MYKSMSKQCHHAAHRLYSAPFTILLVLQLVAVAQASSGVFTHTVDVLPVSFPGPVSDLNKLPNTEKKVFSTIDLSAPIVPFDELSKTLVMEAGDVDTLFSFSFLPELGFNISDYDINFICSNQKVLHSEDVAIGPPVLMESGRANFTANVGFERSVGKTDLTVIFKRQDQTIYSSISVHFIVCGISFFHVDQRSGQKVLVPNNEFMTTSTEVASHGGLEVFYTYIQFPDGSTSEGPFTDFARLPDLSTMSTTLSGNGTLASHNFDTCVTNHAYRTSGGSLTLDKECSFGFTKWNATHQPYFGVRLLKYRTGRVAFHFQWNEFLKGSSLDDIFETSLVIIVKGSVLPSVIAITPSGPFQKVGGQMIDCVVINASPDHRYVLKIGNNSMHPAAVKKSSEGWTVISFSTPPGEGKNIHWDLSYAANGSGDRLTCPWGGDTDRFVFNYVNEDILITSLNPSYGPIRGGTTITCNGHFGNFSLSGESGDAFVLGSYVMERQYIISVTKKTIVFKLPPKEVVQSPTYEVGCVVIVHGIRSNEVKFVYESLTKVSIDFTGASYEKQNDTHMVPLCGSGRYSPSDLSVSMFADVNNGAPLQTLSYEWRIVVISTRTEVAKMGGSSDAQAFSLSVSKFSIHETYEAIVQVSDPRYKTQVSASVKIQLTRSKVLGVGLSLDQTRTIALPPVDTRISASVTEHGTCYGRNNKLSYDWTFRSATKTLSAASKDVDLANPSPRRLGREYIVPSSSLVYGQHRVTVKVYYTDDPSIYGTASTWLNVKPAPLRPIIGSGESQIQVSGSSDLKMTGEQSYDPDSTAIDSSDGLSYEWGCDLSTEDNEKFASVAACPDQLLPYRSKKAFTVSTKTLKFVRFLNTTTYVRYSLVVRKRYKDIGVLASPKVYQVVQILATDESLASRGKFSISNTDGRPLYLNHIPYYDTFVLSPRGSPDVSWRFRLLEPAEEIFTFLKNPQNLIALPGFYRSDELIAGSSALGITQGALKPNTEYKFEVLFESRSADSPNAIQVKVHTMPKPTVKFLPLSRGTGNTETMFSAVAVSSVDDHSFRYHFYIKMSDGSEMCIDGCSGERKVTFRVPMVGEHKVRCTMVDARGKYVIDEAREIRTLTIHAKKQNESSVESQSEALQESFDLGDHSAFEVESVHLASYAKSVPSNSSHVGEFVSELVSVTIEKLASMYRKTQPNSALARDYVLIASSYASIPVGHDAMGSMDTFFGLCQMVYYAVQNTPLYERFDMATELSVTFAQLASHARQLHSGGTTRLRLIADGERSVRDEAEVNEGLLELHELIVPLTARVLARGAGCGTVDFANVSDVGTVHVAVLCSKEQGLRLAGEHAAMEWCESVFARDGQRKTVFALGEFGDYVKESGVLTTRKSIGRGDVEENEEMKLETVNDESHGYVLAKTMIARADDDFAGAQRIGSSGVKAMDAADDGTGNGTCFSLQQDVRASAALFPGYVEVVCRSASAVEYVNTKTLSVDLPTEPYMERSLRSRIVNEAVGGDRQSSIRVASSLASLNGRTFGVKREECRDVRPRIFGESASWWVPLLAVAGTLLSVMLLGFYGVRRELSLNAELWVDTGDAPYIERDAYGRDLGHFDQERLRVDANGEELGEGGEEVVFESPRVRTGGDTERGASEMFRDYR